MTRNLDMEGFIAAIRARDVVAVNAYIVAGIDINVAPEYGFTSGAVRPLNLFMGI